MIAASKKAALILFLVAGLLGTVSASDFNPDSSCSLGYHFDESSSPAVDFCGSNNGTWNGALTSGVQGVTDSQGGWNDGLAYDFDGTDDYVNVGEPSGLTASSLGDTVTLSVWVKPTDVSTTDSADYYLAKGSNSNNDNIAIRTVAPNDEELLDAYFQTTSETNELTVNSTSVDTWYHLVLTYDGSTVEFYVNNSLEASASTSGDIASAGGSPWAVGSRGGDQWFASAVIDEPKIYNRAVSQQEVDNLYNYNNLDGEINTIQLNNPDPSDGSSNIPSSTDLSIDYNNSLSNDGNLTFYWQNNTEIGQITEVSSGSTASTSNLDLDYDTSYTWYVEASDGENTNYAGNYSFTTESFDSGISFTNIQPGNGSTGLNTTVDLNFTVEDSNNDSLDFAGIEWQNGSTLVNQSSVSNGSTISASVSNLEASTSYEWTAFADDGTITEEQTFNFKTAFEVEGDYSFAVLPDTQYYAESYPDIYYNQTQFIANNNDSFQYVIHEGDLVNNPTSSEYDVADQAFQDLENANVPYSMVVGNHDGSTDNHDFPEFKNYFPLSRRSSDASYSNSITYSDKFEVQGDKFMVVNLGLCPTDNMLSWANQTVENNPEYNTIVNVHINVIPDYDGGGRSTRSNPLPSSCPNYGMTGNTGQEQWDKFVKYHENIFAVTSGHYQRPTEVGGDGASRVVEEGVNGNTVYSMLADYQFQNNGGNGWMRFWNFDQSKDIIQVKTYSPYLDQYNLTSSYMTIEDQYFTIEYNQMTGSPSISIDSPQNQTYSTDSIDLNVTSDEAANYTYNLNGGTNTTVNENDKDLNETLSGYSSGSNTVNVYAEDSAGNTAFSSVTFTYQESYVELGKGVEIEQPGNNATINITSSFNVSSLSTYDTATSFGGSNFSVTGSLSDAIDVRLDSYNASKGIGSYAVNLSASTVDGNNVSFDFDNLDASSKYRVDQGSNVYDQSTSDGNGAVSFNQESWSQGSFQQFDLLRTDDFVPELDSGLYRDDQTNGVSRLEFGLNDFSESDISSFAGSGSASVFSNQSLEVDVSPPVDSTYNVSDDSGLTSENRAVNLDSTDTGVQEHSYSHDFSTQQVNRSTTYTNNAGKALDYVLNHSVPGTVQSGGNFSGTISASSSTTETSVAEGDFLNEKEHSFTPTPTNDEVVLGVDYKGQKPLEVSNSENVEFTGVNTSGVLSTPGSCGQNNASTVDVDGNADRNYSVEYSCDPGSIGSPTQDIVNVSDNEERVWYNSTDMQINSNQTEEFQFAIRADKDNMKNPTGRDGGSLEAYVEGENSTGNNQLNVTDTGAYFRITVGTSFQQSSLHTDDSDWSVTYTLSGDDTDEPVGGGGGGSGGDSTSSQTVYFGAEGQASEVYTASYGEAEVEDLTITNTERRQITVNIRKGSNRICDYITVQKSFTSSDFGEGGTYQMPEAVENFGSVEISNTTQLRFELPNRTAFEDEAIEDTTCSFETTASYGEAEDLEIEVDASTSLWDQIVAFLTETFTEVPVGNTSVTDPSVEGEAEVKNWHVVSAAAVLLIGLFWWRRR